MDERIAKASLLLKTKCNQQETTIVKLEKELKDTTSKLTQLQSRDYPEIALLQHEVNQLLNWLTGHLLIFDSNGCCLTWHT